LNAGAALAAAKRLLPSVYRGSRGQVIQLLWLQPERPELPGAAHWRAIAAKRCGGSVADWSWVVAAIFPKQQDHRAQHRSVLSYVGFRVEGLDVGLDPHGHSKGMTGPVGYWHVDDINETLKTLLDARAETMQAISDVGGGKLIATVKDTDGNIIGLLQMPDGGLGLDLASA
jgi:predicted enzyme related to lactoylglutathione lyase